MDEEILNTIFATSSKPFQVAKGESKILCAECYKSNGEIKLFLKGAGLMHHFKASQGAQGGAR